MWLVNSLKYMFLMFKTHRYSQMYKHLLELKQSASEQAKLVRD